MLSSGKAVNSVMLKHCVFPFFSFVDMVVNLLLITEQSGKRNTRISTINLYRLRNR